MANFISIACIGKNNELGKDSNLIWRIKEDNEFFWDFVKDKNVLVGRKTFNSIPQKLRKKDWVVLSKSCPFDIRDYSGEWVVIGGGEIYKETLPYLSKMILTEVDAGCKQADAFYPQFNKKEWTIETSQDFTDGDLKYKRKVYRNLVTNNLQLQAVDQRAKTRFENRTETYHRRNVTHGVEVIKKENYL